MTVDTSNQKYKRMAKNAGMLYIRMLLTMAVTLYTSRVVLQTLGVDDFGIYSVVAGFVTMLGFLHGAMSSATQRFLAFELGKEGQKDVRGIFSMSMNIHILIAFVVLLLGETVGLWFVQNKMTIPADRLDAATWVFHLALLSFMVTIVSVPYNALIIAHERMSVFAWVSIIDVTLKLIIVFMLGLLGMDKLVLYGLLSLAVVFVVFMIYRGYCKVRFTDAGFRLYWDQELFRIMLSYTGWNLWGNIAAVMSGQGVNVMLNIFFGPSVNAARAIAMQVSAALNSFVQNLQVAVNPQIIKSYAAQDMAYMHRLVCYGAKYNFFLLFFLSMPVLINTDLILQTWLGTVPEYSEIFLQLIIVNILIDSVSGPLMTTAQATGKIRLYQSVVGGILLLNVPFSYFLLKGGGAPHTVVYVGVTASILAFLARLIIIKHLINFPVNQFLQKVILRVIMVTLPTVAAYKFICHILQGPLEFLVESTIATLCLLLSIYIFGLEKEERGFIISKVNSICRKSER